MEIFRLKLAGFAKFVTNIGKQITVYLYSGATPGLKGSKKKIIVSVPNITEIVLLPVTTSWTFVID